MTSQKINDICKYANGVYYRDYNNWFLNNVTFEDFKQSLLCLALEFPKDSVIYLVRRYKYSQMCAPEQVPFKIKNMKTFTEITHDIEDSEQLIELLGGEYNPFDFSNHNNAINVIAEKLYEKEEQRDRFLDYMHGQSIGGSRQRDCRNKLFNHRFEILKTLLLNGTINFSYYKYLLNVANQMDKPCSVKKDLNMSSGAVIWRNYYEKNKAKLKERRKQKKLKS